MNTLKADERHAEQIDALTRQIESERRTAEEGRLQLMTQCQQVSYILHTHTYAKLILLYLTLYMQISQQLDKGQASKLTLEKRLESYEATLTSMQQQYQDKLTAELAANEALQTQCTALHLAHEQLRSQVGISEGEAKRGRVEVQRLKDGYDAVQVQYKEQCRLYESVCKDHESLQVSHDVVEQRLQEHVSEVTRLSEQLTHTQQERENLKARLTETSAKYTSELEQGRVFAERINALEATVTALESEKAVLPSENQRLLALTQAPPTATATAADNIKGISKPPLRVHVEEQGLPHHTRPHIYPSSSDDEMLLPPVSIPASPDAAFRPLTYEPRPAPPYLNAPDIDLRGRSTNRFGGERSELSGDTAPVPGSFLEDDFSGYQHIGSSGHNYDPRVVELEEDRYRLTTVIKEVSFVHIITHAYVLFTNISVLPLLYTLSIYGILKMREEMEALQQRLRDQTAGPLEKGKVENTTSQLASAMQTDEIARLKVIATCVHTWCIHILVLCMLCVTTLLSARQVELIVIIILTPRTGWSRARPRSSSCARRGKSLSTSATSSAPPMPRPL